VITVTGRVVDERGAELSNLTVEGAWGWLLTTKQLARNTTDSQGRFTLAVPEILDFSDVPRSFQIRVLDVCKRPLTKDRELSGTVTSHDLAMLLSKCRSKRPACHRANRQSALCE